MELLYVKEEDLHSLTQEEFDAIPSDEKKKLVNNLQLEVYRLMEHKAKSERMKLLLESIGVFYETYKREIK